MRQRLTPAERALYILFKTYRGKLVTWAMITAEMEEFRRPGTTWDQHSVRVLIHRMRRKGCNLRVRRGKGYIMP